MSRSKNVTRSWGETRRMSVSILRGSSVTVYQSRWNALRKGPIYVNFSGCCQVCHEVSHQSCGPQCVSVPREACHQVSPACDHQPPPLCQQIPRWLGEIAKTNQLIKLSSGKCAVKCRQSTALRWEARCVLNVPLIIVTPCHRLCVNKFQNKSVKLLRKKPVMNIL